MGGPAPARVLPAEFDRQGAWGLPALLPYRGSNPVLPRGALFLLSYTECHRTDSPQERAPGVPALRCLHYICCTDSCLPTEHRVGGGHPGEHGFSLRDVHPGACALVCRPATQHHASGSTAQLAAPERGVQLAVQPGPLRLVLAAPAELDLPRCQELGQIPSAGVDTFEGEGSDPLIPVGLEGVEESEDDPPSPFPGPPP